MPVLLLLPFEAEGQPFDKLAVPGRGYPLLLTRFPPLPKRAAPWRARRSADAFGRPFEGHLRRGALAEQEPGLDPLDEDARLNSLDERLRRARTEEAIRSGEVRKDDGGRRLGNRVLAELLGGLIGGVLVGLGLDHVFGTTPWLLLAFLFIGIANAFRNIIRITSQRS